MIDGRSPGSRHFFAPLTFPLSQWPGKTLKKGAAVYSCGGSHG